VTPLESWSKGRLSRTARLLLFLAAAGVATMLFIAARLTPDPHGYGTHQKLGLPPCTFLAIFRRPCPSCGMTTAWAHVVRGQLASACRANAGGAILAIVAMLAVPAMLLAAVTGRWRGPTPGGMPLLVGGIALAAVIIAQWIWRLLGS
jgi:hypothetical protein